MASAATDRELVARKGFIHFIRLAWPHLPEAGKLVEEPHIELIARHLEGLYYHPAAMDMVVNVPPGTSKSTICSVLFMAWVWTIDPTKKFMHVGYDESLQLRFAERSKELVMSDWYQARWPEVEIVKGERSGAGFYENTKGGQRFSTMMGGKAVGRHAHILVFDDPHKPDDLNGDPDSVKAELVQAWTRFNETFSTRRADAQTFKRLCIMQRLHVDDIAGKLVREEPDCVHLRLPMEYEPEAHCATVFGQDWRVLAGELLSPLRFPKHVVDKERRRLTARAFASQHQQRPTPAQGALFQREWFLRRHLTVPHGAKFMISVDSSLKDNKDSDYFVAQVWAAVGASDFYLCDQVRGRMLFSEQVEAIVALRKKWPHVGNIVIEDKANGTAIVDTLRRKVPGVVAVNPEGGKVARANAAEPYLKAGNVSFVDAPWVDALDGLIEEAVAFPLGSHDDMVDAMSQALLWLTGRSRSAVFKKAMANIRAGYGFR
jgi:predicted phage terminase large subunit-like protein